MKYRIQLLLFALLTLNVSGQTKKVDCPIKNFEVLWKAFDNHYAFFDLKTISWEDIHKKYKTLINDSTSNDSLFTICSQMLKELEDGHVNLFTKSKHFNAGKPNNFYSEFSKKGSINDLIQITDSSLAKLGFSNVIKVYRNNSKDYRSLIEISNSSNYGYIRINAMEGLSQLKLERVLKVVEKHFSSSKGVIIDVRFNGGGKDTYSYQIADRFADKKRIGHYKCTRKASDHNNFTKLKTWYLKPKGVKQITVPIILLTSNASASATDVFVLAMKQLPHVTIIGDNTFGVFSDMYESKLPNGWKFSLSHQKYFSADMKCYEGIGVAPDIRLLNSMNDVEQKKDPLINKAIDVLSKKVLHN